jgi:hypothetical protein
VGGGIFCGFLWLYVVKSKGLKLCWWQELLSLYALVCSLGVAVELVEVLFLELGYIERNILDVRTTDTSWDLVANTAGMLTFWAGYRLVMALMRSTADAAS